MIRHLIFRVPKKGIIILTTTHLGDLYFVPATCGHHLSVSQSWVGAASSGNSHELLRLPDSPKA